MPDTTAPPVADRVFAALVGLGYLLAGLVWIGFSDQAGGLLFASPESLTRYQTYKGVAFVVASALLVFVLAARGSRRPAPAAAGPARAGLGALLAALVLVTAVPLMVALGYDVWQQTRAGAEEARARVQGLAHAAAARAQAYLEERHRLAQLIGRRPAGGDDARDCPSSLAVAADLLDDVVDILWFDASGATVCSARGGVAVVAPGLPPAGGRVDMVLAPATAPSGQPLVALTSSLAPGAGSMQLLLAPVRLQRVAAGSAAVGVGVTLLTSSGGLLARVPGDEGAAATAGADIAALAAAAGQGRSTALTVGADGRERLHALQAVPGTNVLAAAGVEVDEAIGPARGQALRSLGVAGTVLLLATLLLSMIVRRIAVPMRALARTAEAVAAGDVARRAPAAGPREVARVAVEFNRMLDRLPALEQALRDSEERHRTLLQKLSRHIPGTLFQLCMAPDGRLWVPFASEAIEPMFEATPAQAQVDAMAALGRIHPDDKARILDALRVSAGSLELRYRVQLPAHGLRHYLTYAHPEPQDDGSVLWHGCTLDVTSLEQARLALRQANETLEARVDERTRALAAANDSLESFSYSVAHDLRAPLAAIGGFAEALPGVLERGDHPRLVRLADRIVANTQRMGAMIDGLLEVARAGNGELQDVPVSQARLVAGVLAELAPPASIEVRVAPLPPVRGDPATLRQVWWNLLANAVKFTGQRAGGRIEIGWERRGDDLVFSVRDNGAGFDPQSAGRLFTAFQRLHDAREFEGTGIGLALVRRVVERHGGRAWAEGRPGEGACFHFALPASRLAAPDGAG